MLAASISVLLQIETRSPPGFFSTSPGALRPHLERRGRFLQVVFSRGLKKRGSSSRVWYEPCPVLLSPSEVARSGDKLLGNIFCSFAFSLRDLCTQVILATCKFGPFRMHWLRRQPCRDIPPQNDAPGSPLLWKVDALLEKLLPRPHQLVGNG